MRDNAGYARRPVASAAKPPIASDQRAPTFWPTQPTIGPPIGVDPSHATDHNARTRPRIDGAAASWSQVFAIELKLMLPYPTRSSTANSIERVGAAAAARMAMPQKMDERPRPAALTCERRAVIVPPITAPAPITAIINPYVPASPLNADRATSGNEIWT